MTAKIREKRIVPSQRTTKNPRKISSSPNPAEIVTVANRSVIDDCSSLIPKIPSPTVSPTTRASAPNTPKMAQPKVVGVAPGNGLLFLLPLLKAFKSDNQR